MYIFKISKPYFWIFQFELKYIPKNAKRFIQIAGHKTLNTMHHHTQQTQTTLKSKPYFESLKRCASIIQTPINTFTHVILCNTTQFFFQHGGLPAKGKEVFVYTSGLEIEWTQVINFGFVVTGPLRTLWLLHCTICSAKCFEQLCSF